MYCLQWNKDNTINTLIYDSIKTWLRMRETKAETKTKKIMELQTIVISIGTAMLAIIGFFLVRLVNSIDGMAKDIGEIKISIGSMSVKHDSLEQNCIEMKEEIKELQKRVFA